jgi:hypothetical protein
MRREPREGESDYKPPLATLAKKSAPKEALKGTVNVRAMVKESPGTKVQLLEGDLRALSVDEVKKQAAAAEKDEDFEDDPDCPPLE